MEPKDANPNFSICCRPENVTFAVQKAKLIEGSEVFADMFTCCDGANEGSTRHSLDVYESSDNVAIIVRLLHDPPLALPENKSRMKTPSESIQSSVYSGVVPYLLLPQLFALAEKYALKPTIMQILQSHLAAQASIAPLLVYGLATRYSFADIADQASKILAFTPLQTYTADDIKVIPSAEAYHKLLQLQDYRERKIRDLLMNEELFPHGYGACPSHTAYAETTWDRKRKSLLADIESGTNVAAKMSQRVDIKIRHCKICRKAWIAATEMLAYKCKRVARRISQLPIKDS